ncbi:glycosyltransferase family 4 protein [Polynucleobacter sp. MWH-Spelu-300-X4]|uniref:glycosyltransferase family 4 protein n=1 Tax=Polynucleobacter sp. MWH-Spelu-300-X4 TaxID=2689109 RepID=UPI001BFCD6BF|nr:glycosyltransferase family 4 protein [Polynucleobacter sp. MWH-Spelu-300-X4]QWD80055.1 glycosyltransferase family 4 protein [Polynucleobacter sp. MWH-Spelu-300-X4]
MHILFLTDNFPPEVNAPASRTFEHCREWVKAGHQVTVITGAPNFPKGKVFDGYCNRLWQQEIVAGIRVIRVWTYITANEGFSKRTLDYLSYMLTGFLASLFVRRVDIVVGTSPQFFTVCAAYASSLIKRVPWVFELRDIWPESIRVVGAMKQRKVLDLLEKVELFLYRKASVIVSVTHAFRTSLMRRGVNGDKIRVVTNGVDISRFSPRDKDTELLLLHRLQGKFVAGYIGTHGLAHALDTLLDAAKALKATPDGDRFRIILLGDGANKASLRQRAETEGLDNVIFVDSVSKDQVVRYWSLLDASIIHLKKDKLFTTVIPSKLFECMGMAIPMLHGVQGESADIVEREDVGLLFEPENTEALVDGLRRLADDPELLARFKANGPLGAKHYDRSSLAAEMLQILKTQAGKA